MNMLIAATSLAIAAAALAPAAAQVAPAAKAGTVAKAHSRADVQAKVAGHFAKMDADRDGFVTRAEADAAREKMRAGMRERFAQRVEKREARRGEAFDRLDANKDGAISREEFEARARARQVRIARPGGQAMRMHRGMRMGALHGRMFEMADSDKDGRVSLAEAQSAALRHFDMADANRDGTVTREERRDMRRRAIEAHRTRQAG